MWYPPVRRTLVCLSKLYRCLDREIFQGLSQVELNSIIVCTVCAKDVTKFVLQEALTACMDSVALAADQITANNKTKSKEGADMDGRLFRIKHLLILREQVNGVHLKKCWS